MLLGRLTGYRLTVTRQCIYGRDKLDDLARAANVCLAEVSTEPVIVDPGDVRHAGGKARRSSGTRTSL